MRRIALVLSLFLAPAQLAWAQVSEPEPAPPSSGPARTSGLVLGAGIDYRYVYNYFYFYAYPSAGYSETESTLPSVAVEASWRFRAAERLSLAPGVGLAVGAGSADFAQPRMPGMTSYSAWTYHAEIFGEAAFALTPRLAVLGRLGWGATGVEHDKAADGASSGLFAFGVRIGLTERLSLAALYQGVFSPSGWTDADVTPASPTLDGYKSWAIQTRLLLSL